MTEQAIMSSFSATEQIKSQTQTQTDLLLDHLGDYIHEPFEILGSYFDGKPLERLTRHQLESYNQFVTFQMQRTIDMFNPIVIHSDNRIHYKNYLSKCSVMYLNPFH